MEEKNVVELAAALVDKLQDQTNKPSGIFSVAAADNLQLAEELLVSLRQLQEAGQPAILVEDVKPTTEYAAGFYPQSLTLIAGIGEGLQAELDCNQFSGLTVRVYNRQGEQAGVIRLQATPEGVYLKRITYSNDNLIDRTSQLIAPENFTGSITPPDLAVLYSQALENKE